MTGYAYWEGTAQPESGAWNPPRAGIKVCGLSDGASARRARHFECFWHERIISHNLRAALVENIAMLYVDRGVELAELVKEGNLGLARALENFEFEGGPRFSSYAARCIRQNMERAIMKRSSIASPIALSLVADSCARRTVSCGGAGSGHQGI